MSDLLVTVAPTGAETLKADVPALPTTLPELLATAKECEAAGAGLIHVHLRDDEHRPTLDPARLRDAVAALRAETSLVVQLSTGGSVHDPLDARLAVLDARPDSCSLTCGTVNFGDDVFVNPWPFMVDLHVKARELGVVPEYELFDLGHVHAMTRLVREHGLPAGGGVHCDLVLGVPGAAAGTPQTLAASIAMGGHVRVGMEDNLFYARRRPVTANAELVARAVRIAGELQRPVLDGAGARRLLRVPPRD